MEVIWFTENYPPNKGGMARSCDRIVRNLRKHYHVHVFHFTNKAKAFEREEQVGGSYTALPVYEDFLFTLNVAWSFVEKDELVKNSSCLVSYGSNLCLKGIPLFSQWLEKPLLSCFRGNDFDHAVFSQKRQDVLYAVQHSNAIACVTQEKASRVKKLGLNDHVFFTHNSIDLSEWATSDLDKQLATKIKQDIDQKDKHIIGLIGYLKPKKGISFLVETIKHTYLKEKLHFRIIGDIDPELEWLIKTNEISYSVTTPDSRTSLIANYLVCDAVIIPSLYDGMPNVLFEAGALKVPILASRAGGLQDVLTAENAYLFDVLSTDQLLNQLENFVKASASDLEQKTETLFRLIEKQYTPQKEIENYLSIFSKFI
ncbi:glycosyltransferase family 4 protein [Aquimarina spongiae]|uniref:Glycosyltransferase involved in cell wall bisynthesis n=1 Tax=Aquimarina spongiae TaxID=570521 RepID=A0A1M6GHB1_9FLAO|nr:glycosyltransferase family 4 protein [Aquimarina spongiae]SHJ09272.1 Glycosyltransferase involved in cell wall bisynthesis [Aquimarina spongiae]